jgi:hypothetical protein
MEHLPSAQHAILPLASLDIIGQPLPSLLWQAPFLQQSPLLAQQVAPLPQHAILPSVLAWSQQAQDLALLSAGAGVLWDVL